MRRFRLSRALLVLTWMVLLGTNRLSADVIPPGNKRVSHKLVFVDSPLLKLHRLVALPVRGFGGHAEIQPNRPFNFSTKYGTRLYVVPHDFVLPAKLTPGEPLPFPSCGVPVSSTSFVPILSPIDSLQSTCKLVAVEADKIQVELVDHVELNALGQSVTLLDIVFPLVIISSIGLIGCCLIWRRTRRSRIRTVA